MRILFSSTWGYGHVFPMVPLARAFQAAGHEVRWATHEPAVAIAAAAGLDAVRTGLDVAGVREVTGRNAQAVAALRPQDRAAFAFPHMFGAWAAPRMAPGLLELADEWRPDLMVHEQAELAAPWVATVLDLPLLTHSFGGAVPAAILAAAGEQLRALWSEQGLELPEYAGCYADGYLDICPTPLQTQSLSHIRRRLEIRPESYTGEPAGGPDVMLTPDDRPLVYVTLGTVFAQAEVLAEAVRGVAALPVRVLVTVGPQGQPEALGDQPDNVSVVTWVQQSEVLRHSSVVVSHAGSGTFLGALGLGIPQLCLPQAADQFRNAEAALSTGTGLVLTPDAMSAAAITAAVQRLLDDATLRAKARAMAEVIAQMPSAAEVAAALDRAGYSGIGGPTTSRP
ncbi:putative Glycosyltransferase, MGT family [metagenome]|uniref:Putative Glycosyltransferase, MGT family n=1 Tax=metagenome TaxID=256318 RepID=A0A2P2C067_9ZZZZ